MKEQESHFTPFKTSIQSIELPHRFNFPFYYQPHKLSLIAAQELQDYLICQSDWEHNFGLDPKKSGLVIGKMFGVLVVKNKNNELGYLSAFSGKLANENHHIGFVPPVYDILKSDSFFIQEEILLNELNDEIALLEQNKDYRKLQQEFDLLKDESSKELSDKKKELRETKKDRKSRRENGRTNLNSNDFDLLCEQLKNESLEIQFHYKDLNKKWKETLNEKQSALDVYSNKIKDLKSTRKKKSGELQQRIFDHYQFLNANKHNKSLGDIFSPFGIKPPAGAGECAAPKLLQYAYKNDLTPICMAEFYWGKSPNTEVRKHKHFYPACNSKCRPILGHMLEGLNVDPNPFLENPAEGKEIDIVYEDEFLCVVNKPAEFLSVPGINIQDSVADRMKAKYPRATGPLIVHRLDMSTSGLILIAKSEHMHKKLQEQFIKRTVKKRYVALLDGDLTKDSGLIDLPLRVDLDDRPRQLVCYEHGKPAQTKFEVIERKNGKTKVYFYPLTGRTHQLRVHAAHSLGLNTSIVGDDLYGQINKRLHLHAEYLSFTHPNTKEVIEVQIEPDF